MNTEPMTHERVRALLNGYVDGELDLLTTIALEQHLQGCAACSAQLHALRQLHQAAGDRALYRPAPAGLGNRVRAALDLAAAEETRLAAAPSPSTEARPVSAAETPRSAPLPANPARTAAARSQTTRPAARRPSLAWPGQLWQWLIPAAALLAVLMFAAGFLARGALAPRPETLLAEEVQNAHVRSLMTDHLMDVASSDQHTVKPWFDGKLNFSPPVTDLAAQGYPLVGGRLDYLNGQPVAALVYRRNKHIINLFIWPTQALPTGQPAAAGQNGYNQLRWTESGMTFWAISDVNAEDLQAFMRAFRAGT